MKWKMSTNVEVDENGRKVTVEPCYFSGRTMHLTYESGRKPQHTKKTGRKPHPTNKTGRKPQKQTLVKKDDKYTVKCKL